MKITIESTAEKADVNGVPARIWKGKTEGGTECMLFVTRIMVPTHRGIGPEFKQDMSEFERELNESPKTELTIGGYELRGPISMRLIV